ncbi:MAG: hypothetical protein JXP34_10915 [Planctomycetes bacterium]|nr:hypothetical protein [Planctomycetota bacterium]
MGEIPNGKMRESSGETQDARSLEKVREILIGAHVRDIDKRFSEMEKRLAGEVARMAEDAKGRFERLEAVLREGIQSVSERLAAEEGSRKEALADQSREMSETLESRFAELSGRLAEAEEGLRRQTQAESERLSDEIRRSAEEASEALRQAVAELSEEKTDRGALADLLSEAADRIRQGTPSTPVR